MFDFLKKLAGSGPSVDFAELRRRGAQIVDVRSPDEYRGGHINGSMNLPLPHLERHLGKLRKDKPVITCCASGMRSASAKRALEENGFAEVVNGGGWAGLSRMLDP
ncbi:MAG: sulfurtransferase [Fibrobacteria bacterium]|jgi:rhodanese-related sulfurtransferase|nr:sulfurtransferase [Fibrobacteria bacterium]